MAESDEDSEDSKVRCERCGKTYTVRAQHMRWCRGSFPIEQRPPTPPPVVTSTGPDVARMVFADALQANMAEDLADMRYQRGFDEADIALVKERVQQRIQELVEAAPHLLSDFLRDDVSPAQVIQALHIDMFAGLRTARQELNKAKQDVPLLTPRVIDHKPNGKAKIVSFRMAELLLRMLKENPQVRKRVLQKSDEWKKGHNWKKAPTDKLTDLDDGVRARWHPHLMRPATDEEVDDVRIAIISNADDIEVVKQALGAARGLFKQLGCQAAIGNLEASERYKEENILLHCASRTSVYKEFGMARVLVGRGQDGTQHAEQNYGKDMRELDTGVWDQIPDDVHGGFRWIRLRAWDMATAADYLGAQAMTVHYESPSSNQFCRACNFDKRHPNAYRPFSFHRAPRDGTPAFKLREWSDISEVLAQLRTRDFRRGEREALMATHSIKPEKTLAFVLHPDSIPHINPCRHAPVDLLHVFPDGLLRSEGAWLVYVLAKLGLAVTAINERIRTYPAWPRDVRVPDLRSKLTKGVQGGRPQSQSTLAMSGSECMHFALHSIDVLSPLLTPEMRAHPAWASWCKLVELFSLVVQHEIKLEDVERIDDLQLQHSELFDAVPEYAGLKRPKHHFLSHLASDTWLFGPLRGLWTFGFEGFNKRIKEGAGRSNFRQESLTLMEYYSMRTGRMFARLRRARVHDG